MQSFNKCLLNNLLSPQTKKYITKQNKRLEEGTEDYLGNDYQGGSLKMCYLSKELNEARKQHGALEEARWRKCEELVLDYQQLAWG